MNIFNIILILIWLLIVPLLVGYGTLLFFKSKEDYSCSIIYITGYLTIFSLFYILSISFYIFNFSLTSLSWTFALSLLPITVIGLSYLVKKRHLFVALFDQYRNYYLIGAFLLVLIQAIAASVLNLYDADDKFYVGAATTSLYTDTILKYEYSTGELYGYYHIRYIMSPFPIFYAVIGKLTQVHPAIIARTVLPFFFIFIIYAVYVLLANKFINREYKTTFLFVFFVSILNYYGNLHWRSSSAMLLERVWHGKVLLLGMIFPLLMIYLPEFLNDNALKMDNYLIITIIITACLLSSMSAVILPFIIMAIAISKSIIDKKLVPILRLLLTLAPSIAMGVMFIVFSGMTI